MNTLNDLIDAKLGITGDDDKHTILVLTLTCSISKLPATILFYFSNYTEMTLYGILWIILREQILQNDAFEHIFNISAHKLHLYFINR
jgi:hypothetical protein